MSETPTTEPQPQPAPEQPSEQSPTQPSEQPPEQPSAQPLAQPPAQPPKPAPFHKRHKCALLATFALCVIVALIAALLFKTQAVAALHCGMQFLKDIVDAVRQAGPVPYFAAYAILPALGAPISLFNLTVAPTFAPQIGLGWVIVLSAISMALNLALTYWLARYALRPLIEKCVKYLGYTLPVIPRGEHVTTSILLRVVPGPPYAVQSYILGLTKVHFLPYMIVSFIAQFGYALAMILITNSAREMASGEQSFQNITQSGSFRAAFAALVLIVVLAIVTRFVRKYYTKKTALKNANAEPPQ